MKAAYLALLGLAAACGGALQPPPAKVGSAGHVDKDEVLMAENRDIARLEQRDIDGWVQRHGLLMHRTGTGVRIGWVVDSAGATARPGQTVAIDFTVELIDGRVCYSSGGEVRDFRVEQDNVESGLHEAIQSLSPGDSAVIVIPSHRAHGLAGDMDKIPMRSTVIYRLRLHGVR
jgi:hypothetical protein